MSSTPGAADWPMDGWVLKPFSKTYLSVDKPPLVFGSCFTAASFTQGFRFAPALVAPQAF